MTESAKCLLFEDNLLPCWRKSAGRYLQVAQRFLGSNSGEIEPFEGWHVNRFLDNLSSARACDPLVGLDERDGVDARGTLSIPHSHGLMEGDRHHHCLDICDLQFLTLGLSPVLGLKMLPEVWASISRMDPHATD